MFSVVIPYYKKRKYIERCIDSVLAQTFTDFEIIVVDDGSNDDITLVCAEKYGDRVQLIIQGNQGVSAARNKGIANARHDYIAFLDADDCWSPFYLEYANHIIQREKDVKIIGSTYVRNYSELEQAKKNLDYELICNYFNKQIFINTLFTSSSSIILRVFFANNSFKSTLKRGEDLDIWFSAVASGGKAFYIKNKLVYYSDEDASQATQSEGKLEESILFHYKTLYQQLINSDTNFKKSISKFVYLYLVPYYFSTENHQVAKRVLKEIPQKIIPMHLIYLIPFFIGNKLIKTRTGQLRMRQYLKFAAQHM